MHDRLCPHCGAGLKFITLVLAFNPAAIPCQSCGKKIHVHLPSVIALLLGLAVLATAVLWSFWRMGLGIEMGLYVLIALGAALEFGYWKALKRGLIPSSLKAPDPQDPASSSNTP
jgi:prepilin signal peptidase PulO-like enzyme (type II secretory pathway)